MACGEDSLSIRTDEMIVGSRVEPIAYGGCVDMAGLSLNPTILGYAGSTLQSKDTAFVSATQDASDEAALQKRLGGPD